jgi:hypothetical protein
MGILCSAFALKLLRVNVQEISKQPHLFAYAEHKTEEIWLSPVGTQFALTVFNDAAIVAYQEVFYLLLAAIREE